MERFEKASLREGRGSACALAARLEALHLCGEIGVGRARLAVCHSDSPPIAMHPSLLRYNVLGSGRCCDGVARHVPR